MSYLNLNLNSSTVRSSSRSHITLGSNCSIVKCPNKIENHFVRRALCCKQRGLRQGGPEDKDIFNFVCSSCYNAPSTDKLECNYCANSGEEEKPNDDKETSMTTAESTDISPERKKSKAQTSLMKKLVVDVNKKVLVSPYRKVSKGKFKNTDKSLIHPTPPRESDCVRGAGIVPMAIFICCCTYGELKCLLNCYVRDIMSKQPKGVTKLVALKGQKVNFNFCVNKSTELQCANKISTLCFQSLTNQSDYAAVSEKCWDCTAIPLDSETSDSHNLLVASGETSNSGDNNDDQILPEGLQLAGGGYIGDNMSNYFGVTKAANKISASDCELIDASLEEASNTETVINSTVVNGDMIIDINQEEQQEEYDQNNNDGEMIIDEINQDQQVAEVDEEPALINSTNSPFGSPVKSIQESFVKLETVYHGRPFQYYLLDCDCPSDEENVCFFKAYQQQILDEQGVTIDITKNSYCCENKSKGCPSRFFPACIDRFESKINILCRSCTNDDNKLSHIESRDKVEPSNLIPHEEYTYEKDGIEIISKPLNSSPTREKVYENNLIDLSLSPISMSNFAINDSQISSVGGGNNLDGSQLTYTNSDILTSSSNDNPILQPAIKVSIRFKCDVSSCENDFCEEHCFLCLKEFDEKFYYCKDHQTHNKSHLIDSVVESSSNTIHDSSNVNQQGTTLSLSHDVISESSEHNCYFEECQSQGEAKHCADCFRRKETRGQKNFFCELHDSHNEYHMNLDKRGNILAPEMSRNCVECGHNYLYDETIVSESFDNNEDYALCRKCYHKAASEASNNENEKSDDSGDDINEFLSKDPAIDINNSNSNLNDESLPVDYPFTQRVRTTNQIQSSVLSDENMANVDDRRVIQPRAGLTKLNKSLHLAAGRVYDDDSNFAMAVEQNESTDDPSIRQDINRSSFDENAPYDFTNAFPAEDYQTGPIWKENEEIRKSIKKNLPWPLGKNDICTIKCFGDETRSFIRHAFNLINSMAPSDKGNPYYVEINVDKSDEVFRFSFFAKYNWVPMAAIYKRGKKNFGDGLPFLAMCVLYHPLHKYRYVLVAIDCSTCRRPITGFTIFDYDKIDSPGFDGFYLIRSDNAGDMTSLNEFIGCVPLHPFDKKAVAYRYYNFCFNSKLVYDPSRGIQVVSRYYEVSNLQRGSVPVSEQFDPRFQIDPSYELWYPPSHFYNIDFTNNATIPTSVASSGKQRISSRIENDKASKQKLEDMQLLELEKLKTDRPAATLENATIEQQQITDLLNETQGQIAEVKSKGEETFLRAKEAALRQLEKEEAMRRKELEKEEAKRRKELEKEEARRQKELEKEEAKKRLELEKLDREQKRLEKLEQKRIEEEERQALKLQKESEEMINLYRAEDKRSGRRSVTFNPVKQLTELVYDNNNSDDDATIVPLYGSVKNKKSKSKKESKQILSSYVEQSNNKSVPSFDNNLIVQMNKNSKSKDDKKRSGSVVENGDNIQFTPRTTRSTRSSSEVESLNGTRSSNVSSDNLSGLTNANYHDKEDLEEMPTDNDRNNNDITLHHRDLNQALERMESRYFQHLGEQQETLSRERELIMSRTKETQDMIASNNKRNKKLERKIDKLILKDSQSPVNVNNNNNDEATLPLNYMNQQQQQVIPQQQQVIPQQQLQPQPQQMMMSQQQQQPQQMMMPQQQLQPQQMMMPQQQQLPQQMMMPQQQQLHQQMMMPQQQQQPQQVMMPQQQQQPQQMMMQQQQPQQMMMPLQQLPQQMMMPQQQLQPMMMPQQLPQQMMMPQQQLQPMMMPQQQLQPMMMPQQQLQPQQMMMPQQQLQLQPMMQQPLQPQQMMMPQQQPVTYGGVTFYPYPQR